MVSRRLMLRIALGALSWATLLGLWLLLTAWITLPRAWRCSC